MTSPSTTTDVAGREVRDVMAFGQEYGRGLSDGRIVGRAEPFAKVFPSSRAVKRAVGLIAWAVLEDIALDARLDDRGRLVAAAVQYVLDPSACIERFTHMPAGEPGAGGGDPPCPTSRDTTTWDTTAKTGLVKTFEQNNNTRARPSTSPRPMRVLLARLPLRGVAHPEEHAMVGPLLAAPRRNLRPVPAAPPI